MHKPYAFYTALTSMVDRYNNDHNLNRGHLADVLGMRGATPAQQLSNALNPNNQDKHLSISKIDILLNAVDDDARVVFFEEWMRQWGLKPAKLAPCAETKQTIYSWHQIADDAQLEADESFRTIKLSLKDETLTKDELKAIIKEAKEARDLQDQIIRMADRRLRSEAEQ